MPGQKSLGRASQVKRQLERCRSSLLFMVNGLQERTDDLQVSALEAHLVAVDALGVAPSASTNHLPHGEQNSSFHPSNGAMEIPELQDADSYQTNLPIQSSPLPEIDPSPVISFSLVAPDTVTGQPSSSVHRLGQSFSSTCSACWGLPFVQGWLLGQYQLGEHPKLHWSSGTHELPLDQSGVDGGQGTLESSVNNREFSVASLASPSNMNLSVRPYISSLQGGHFHLISSPDNSADVPCTVKLKIWSYDVRNPCAHLDAEKCRLTIPHAVLCSDMGAHFSPCGSYLVASVACMLPQMKPDHGFTSQVNQDPGGAVISLTWHLVSACRVMYKLRIYSVEESTFGSILMSKGSQGCSLFDFHPNMGFICSNHLLFFLHQIFVPRWKWCCKIYRVSDLQLLSSLPSSDDEVNLGCFHSSLDGGLVYGTKVYFSVLDRISICA